MMMNVVHSSEDRPLIGLPKEHESARSTARRAMTGCPRVTGQVTVHAAINGTLIGQLQTLLAHSPGDDFRAHVSEEPLLGHHETLLAQEASISVQFPSARP